MSDTAKGGIILNEENITQQDGISEDHEKSENEQAIPQGGAVVETGSPPEFSAEQALQSFDSAPDYAAQAAQTEKELALQLEQDEKLLRALDEVLEKRSRQAEVGQQKRPRSRSERASEAIKKKGVGFISLGLILIFLGFVMFTTLSSSAPNYTLLLKLSPVCAILIGAEILITSIVTRGRFRVNVISLLISILLVVLCCILCMKLGGEYKEEVVEYNNRTIAGEIYDRSYEKLKGVADITKVEVNVNLNPDGTGKKKGIEALSAGDIVNVNVELGGIFNSPKNFASDCKRIIDSYREMGINVTGFSFKNKSKLRSYTLEVDGQFAQDLDVNRLLEMVNYVYIEDFNYIEDLEDYVEDPDDSE